MVVEVTLTIVSYGSIVTETFEVGAGVFSEVDTAKLTTSAFEIYTRTCILTVVCYGSVDTITFILDSFSGFLETDTAGMLVSSVNTDNVRNGYTEGCELTLDLIVSAGTTPKSFQFQQALNVRGVPGDWINIGSPNNTDEYVHTGLIDYAPIWYRCVMIDENDTEIISNSILHIFGRPETYVWMTTIPENTHYSIKARLNVT